MKTTNKLFAILLLAIMPAAAFALTDQQLIALDWMNYRINVIHATARTADSNELILRELQLIRCKLPPQEMDCADIQYRKTFELYEKDSENSLRGLRK